MFNINWLHMLINICKNPQGCRNPCGSQNAATWDARRQTGDKVKQGRRAAGVAHVGDELVQLGRACATLPGKGELTCRAAAGPLDWRGRGGRRPRRQSLEPQTLDGMCSAGLGPCLGASSPFLPLSLPFGVEMSRLCLSHHCI